MVKLRFQNCGRIVTSNIEENEWRKANCSDCNEKEQFEIYGSEDDTYEGDDDEDDEGDLYSCNICGKEDLSIDEGVFLDPDMKGDVDSFTCKKCIDEAYPRSSSPKNEIKNNSIIPKVF